MSQFIRPRQPLFDYFLEHVNAVHDRQSVTLSETTRLYLADLLSQRAISPPTTTEPITLAELHGQAAVAPFSERLKTYRELGDTALITVGFFEESLSRRAVSSTYYIAMGAAAYQQVHALFEQSKNGVGTVFHELSRWFESCVLLLNLVRDGDLQRQPEQLMRLFTQWEQTRDSRAAKRLQHAGLILPTEKKMSH